MIIFRYKKGDEKLIEEFATVNEALDKIIAIYKDNPKRFDSLNCPPKLWMLESIDAVGWEKNDNEYFNNLKKVRKITSLIALLHRNHRKNNRKISALRISKALQIIKDAREDDDTYVLEQLDL